MNNIHPYYVFNSKTGYVDIYRSRLFTNSSERIET